MIQEIDKKSVVVCIIGRSNVGKSSLTNSLTGQKISIVSHKPQTTRRKVTGIITEDNTQLVFVDTPGVHKAHNILSKRMNKQANESVEDVDVCMLVVEAGKKIHPQEKIILDKFKKLKCYTLLVINKIDLLKDKSPIIKQIQEFSNEFKFNCVVPVSVKTNSGLNIIKKELKKQALPGGYIFDDDIVTDQPLRVIFAEFIREKLLLLLNEEIPHGIAVDVETMKKRRDGVIDVNVAIYCEKTSHKGIIIGKNGQLLKKVGTLARKELEDVFNLKINLKLWVKIKDDWRNKDSLVGSFIYGKI